MVMASQDVVKTNEAGREELAGGKLLSAHASSITLHEPFY
jgi:hypothetical protein